MLTVTKLLSQLPENNLPTITLSLTAEERTRTRHRFETSLDGKVLLFRLPRGTILQEGDLLQSESGEVIKIVAKPEPVITVTAPTELILLRAAYHLGNRHVVLEIAPNYLRCSSDLILKKMLEQLGLEVQEEMVSFQPEIGAYRQKH